MGGASRSNFNNDGTALYEAMARSLCSNDRQHLTFAQQFVIVVTSIIASVGAAESRSGLVTMTLVSPPLGCRLSTSASADGRLVSGSLSTTINVLGDVNISCLLDGKRPSNPASASTRSRDVKLEFTCPPIAASDLARA